MNGGSEWRPPEGHPISLEKARELLASDLGDVYRAILRKSCAPIFWYETRRGALGPILNNGTVTFARTPKRLIGITAAHVIRGYLADAGENVGLQIWDASIDDLRHRIISLPRDGELDIATFEVDDAMLTALGKEIVPLEWPPRAPQPQRGILLAGYPGLEVASEGERVTFGLYTCIGIARTVSNDQITWLREGDWQLAEAKVPAPPPRYKLGGVSGGPLITCLESDSHITTFALGGVITEHPDYEKSDVAIERLIATRADCISESGRVTGAAAANPRG
jgi:hypothetical protein